MGYVSGTRTTIEAWQLPDYLDAEQLQGTWRSGQTGPKMVGCSICGRRVHIVGVCQECYYRARNEEGFTQLHALPECAFDGCSMVRANYGLCYGHYGQIRKGQALRPIKRDWGTSDALEECIVPDCSRVSLNYDAQICKPHRRPVWKYGISLANLESLYRTGECGVCGRSERLHIDHDHSCCASLNDDKARGCGKCIRGLLCFSCNTALGMTKDNPQTLRALADYLESGARI